MEEGLAGQKMAEAHRRRTAEMEKHTPVVFWASLGSSSVCLCLELCDFEPVPQSLCALKHRILVPVYKFVRKIK